MKRGLLIAVAAAVCVTGAYFSFSKWAIRHETVELYDAARDRVIDVDVAIRRDAEVRSMAGLTTLPVAVVNHGNTVKNTEYSFLANVLAMRGYLVLSVQHDLMTDAPLVTKVGQLYVGRLPVYERGVENILFTVNEMKKRFTNADYSKLMMVGHSNGGDISMFFAKEHPEMIKRVVTLDNLRVPFLTEAKFKILSFRSKDPNFVPDPGVVPDDDECARTGIEVIKTGAQHTDMSDRGPEAVKEKIQNTLDQFLSEDSDLRPTRTDVLKISGDKVSTGTAISGGAPAADRAQHSAALLPSQR
ncbi:alpha/beta hydrolase [Bradyrhizobium sp. U87765 SZCCT0131]|uniref:alpha/beta hydrolase n=1 Tax=unclassified Bradyrhizobium TaxID=2631580 RepID=UPI001BA841D7|nr:MULTISPECIES: alpha/beta hydrolase [unclassified Bradyrhizobium]MBR1223246.1 alpha/beta hydrolase [Bradyrhizobium sp. U87765 SZCCT0131]MBR1265784.1 alpha/beta hydrolase [Bradyrhizobium sp. U87765 SZCCT0134]MBR1309245.1 alpha/beta hydrolase [Bradyrhizobium sp. U87765 SZCCT0110]MBR1323176.1 alpha/beta hydrolase [Bradyrhizobium sp. U87765 SZCCT0109]MBR1352471.1 alpha/beta hydrolase [Bradyrhizobium sp. U87765 SZCCT0048]